MESQVIRSKLRQIQHLYKVTVSMTKTVIQKPTFISIDNRSITGIEVGALWVKIQCVGCAITLGVMATETSIYIGRP